MKAYKNIQRNFENAGKIYDYSQSVVRTISSGSTKSRSTTIASEKYGPSTDSYMPLSKMPGPRGLARLPYIGPLFLFEPFSKHKPERYGQLVCSLHDKYGPIFKTRLGAGYTVHTSSVDDIKTIFEQEPMYPTRRSNILNKIYRERNGLPQNLGTCNGPEWHALRSSLNAPLNRPKACLAYLPAVNQVSDDLIRQLLEVQRQDHGDNMADAIFDVLFRFSAESVAFVCYNERLGFLTDIDKQSESKLLLDAFYTHLSSSFKAIIGVERKFLWTENDSFYQEYATAMDCIRTQSAKILNKTLSAFRQANTSGATRDNGKDGTQNPNLLMTLLQTSELEKEHIYAAVESILIAGSDSTARNLSVVFYNLAKDPDIQRRLRDEIINAVGPDGPLTAKALGQMNFLKACVKESMRLYPPVAPGAERSLPKDTVLSGYLVPEGTSVIMSSCQTSRDPKFFTDPLSYKPDRWMRVDGKKVTINPDTVVDPRLVALAFLPFGLGKRSCVGRRFAEMEIFVCVAKVLQKLQVSVDSNYEYYDALETFYTPFVTPMKAIPFKFTEHSNDS